jgi:hypothetical protein
MNIIIKISFFTCLFNLLSCFGHADNFVHTNKVKSSIGALNESIRNGNIFDYAAHMNFVGFDLSDILLCHSNLPTANLTNANLSGSNFSHSDISFGSFVNANLQNCDFSYALLRDCDFTNAQIENTNFRHTILINAIGIDLKNLEGKANFERAILNLEDLMSYNIHEFSFLDYARFFTLNDPIFKKKKNQKKKSQHKIVIDEMIKKEEDNNKEIHFFELLPDELWLEISKFLDAKSRSSFSRSCKRANSIGQDLLLKNEFFTHLPLKMILEEADRYFLIRKMLDHGNSYILLMNSISCCDGTRGCSINPLQAFRLFYASYTDIKKDSHLSSEENLFYLKTYFSQNQFAWNKALFESEDQSYRLMFNEIQKEFGL